MTRWRADLEAHLADLQPLRRRRTPARFDASPQATKLKSSIQAWNRKTRELLGTVPQGKKHLEAFRKLGNMSFSTLESVRAQLKERDAFIRGLLNERPVAQRQKTGVIDRDKKRNLRYDFCLTFAGDDREFAKAVNTALRKRRQKTFFDLNKDARTRLLGEPGPDILHDVFYEEAELCLLFASAAYMERMWTSVERVAAQARSVEQGGSYIIPIRLDSTPIKALPHTIGHLKKSDGVTRIVSEVIAKLKAVREARKKGKTASGTRASITPPGRPKGTKTTTRRVQTDSLKGHFVLLGNRVYTVQQIKRLEPDTLVVTLHVKDPADLTSLRNFNSLQSWAAHRFADKTSGVDVTVEKFEEQTDQRGRTTVTLHLRQQRTLQNHYGLPAEQSEQQIRQLLTGATRQWSPLPQEVQGGVVALAARLVTSPSEQARYAQLLASYYLHKLGLVDSIRDLKITKSGRQYKVKLEADLNTGSFGAGGKTKISLNESVPV